MIQIGGVTIKTPAFFDYEYWNIVDERFTLAGTERADITSLNKIRAVVGFSALTNTERDTLTGILETDYHQAVIFSAGMIKAAALTIDAKFINKKLSIKTFQVNKKIFTGVGFEIVETGVR